MPRWKYRMLFGALAVLAPALAGCEAGYNAPTLEYHPAAFGAYASKNGVSIANAFVLAPYRNQGIGARLLAALLAHADDHGYIRVVLRPSERAIPFYQRAGFTADGGFLIRYAPRS